MENRSHDRGIIPSAGSDAAGLTPPAELIISREPEFPGQVVWQQGATLGIAPDEATARADAAAICPGGGGVSYPMTTTLNRIWACNPCDESKERALRAAGKDAPDDEPITYQQIVESVGLDDALWCCRAEPQYDRKWRLFAVWCARQVQHLISDQRSLDALDVAERYAHGEATDRELAAACAAACAAAVGLPATGLQPTDQVGVAALAAASAAARDASAAAWDARAAVRAAQRDAFIQLVTTGELPPIARQEVAR